MSMQILFYVGSLLFGYNFISC